LESRTLCPKTAANGERLEIDPYTFWGEDQQPHFRFPFPRHPDGSPIVNDFPRDPSRL